MATNLFALCLGFGFVYAGWTYGALARRMRAFQRVSGTVVARQVVVAPTGDTTTAHFGDGGGYTPQVTYRYIVNGVELESRRLAHAVRGYKRAVAERKLAEIPDAVIVWYDPANPSDAYLNRHGPALGHVILALGACLVAGALIRLAG